MNKNKLSMLLVKELKEIWKTERGNQKHRYPLYRTHIIIILTRLISLCYPANSFCGSMDKLVIYSVTVQTFRGWIQHTMRKHNKNSIHQLWQKTQTINVRNNFSDQLLCKSLIYTPLKIVTARTFLHSIFLLSQDAVLVAVQDIWGLEPCLD